MSEHHGDVRSREPVAEVVEITDLMDSYTRRPATQRAIVPYKPIDQLPAGTKLYAAFKTCGYCETPDVCSKGECWRDRKATQPEAERKVE